MGVTLTVEGADKLGQAFAKLPSTVSSGVKSDSDHWAFWEFGKVSIQPGPKTLWSSNAMGERVVLTKQAPHGYIRVNTKQFRQILLAEIRKVNLSTTKMDGWQKAIEGAADRAAQKCCDLIREAAPVDTGDLRNSIEPVFSNDDILSSGGAEDVYYGNATLDLGSLGMEGY